MKHVKLDRIDLILLRELQKDGRATNVDLAKIAGISAPPCLRRIRALEKAGLIRGYHADIAADKLGYGLTAFIHVGLASHTESDLLHFAKQIENWPQVRESYMMTGDSDFLLKIVATDWESFQRFLTSHLAAAPNIGHLKSYPAIRKTKHDPGVPILVPEDANPGPKEG